ncbi:Hypothetical protein NTJ_11580 [Nesidiocoris tenuis]|uniref:Uncharacterized protein n=1 Tax=Nesidiocoris tenuis TaxID=355587 RepID=A0ABN7B301_9HEMI|nr:Hypothetical protein NTJ_11580 [Nesidiocoris tenuis]
MLDRGCTFFATSRHLPGHFEEQLGSHSPISNPSANSFRRSPPWQKNVGQRYSLLSEVPIPQIRPEKIKGSAGVVGRDSSILFGHFAHFMGEAISSDSHKEDRL